MGLAAQLRRSAGVLALVVALSVVVAQAAAAGDDTVIETGDRAAVTKAYKERYLPTRGVRPGWTGSIAGCRKGTVSDAYKRATSTRASRSARVMRRRTSAGPPPGCSSTDVRSIPGSWSATATTATTRSSSR